MSMRQTPPRSPEIDPSSAESQDTDDFDRLLQGMISLADAEGGVTAVDFVERTIAEMKKENIELNDFRLNLILKQGFGAREFVYDRVEGMTVGEFEAAYPDDMGEIVKWYLEPLLSEE